jgi:hypothetical protein
MGVGVVVTIVLLAIEVCHHYDSNVQKTIATITWETETTLSKLCRRGQVKARDNPEDLG